MTCTDIAGATSLQRYTPVAEDVGYELRIKETASAADSDDVVAYSDPTEAVTANIATWQGGELRGFAAVGETLTAFPAANNDAGLPLDVRYTFTRDMGGLLDEVLGAQALGRKYFLTLSPSVLNMTRVPRRLRICLLVRLIMPCRLPCWA